MPRKNSTVKPVHSFRLSLESVHQLQKMSSEMGRSESDVIEVALDRMYREEIRFGRLVREQSNPDDAYRVDKENEE